MTPDQVRLVELSFAKVKPISQQASTIFYDRLFETRPDFRPLFKGDIKEQGRLLMATLATAVALLRRPAQLEQAVEDLGKRHAGYGVRAEYFKPVGDALIWTLEKGLGPDFTPEVKAAWIAMYQVVTVTMVRGLQSGGDTPAKSGAASTAAGTRGPKATWLRRLWGWLRPAR